ncbi:cytochrome P450 93A3-like isoform X2 [Magnolia sinica]|uniref:cytochrome P450 93A3-like isoform X2 n=1 Tax=Magnolia sinica TaxID=86752 RepID=UPI0026582736|nr:cytochrome P450 93A3-like isoform X2 [Magnolia sinica]
MSELTYGGIEIVFSPYDPNWRKMRKVCAREMMSSKVLDSYYGLRRLEVRQMVRDVRTLACTTVNIGELVFQLALNVVMNMIWGGTLDGEGRRKVGLEFQRVINEAIELVSEPNLSDFFPILSRFDVQGVVGRMKKLTSWMDKIFESVLDQRLKMDRGEGGKESKDFLQLLLQLKEEGDTKTPLTLTNIKAIFVDLVIAGTDTTSTTIEWAMAEMLQNPEIMRKVQEELEQVEGGFV